MMAYWRKGESLLDSELREIAGKDFERVATFFSLVAGRWYHKRIDIELAKANANFLKMKEKSMKGVAARLSKSQPHG